MQILKSNAQMAELVDALVSNTNVLGRAGSTPALGTIKARSSLITTELRAYFITYLHITYSFTYKIALIALNQALPK